jgi:hypothetical protein
MPLSKITNPFLDPAGSVNSNVYSPAANTIAITTSGTEKVRVNSSGNVGIGTNSPSNKLTLSSGFVQVGNGVGGAGGVHFPYSSDSLGRTWRVRTDITGYGDFGFEQSTTQSGTTYATQFLLSQTGYVTIPNQPSFRVSFNASSQTTGVIAWNNIKHNIGSYFNTGTYTFTAPVAGRYQFNVMCASLRTTNTGDFYVDLELNGTRTNRIYTAPSGGGSNIHNQASASAVLNLAVGDTVRVTMQASPGNVGLLADEYHNAFSGHLLG